MVLDPLHMDLGANELSKKHYISVSLMHQSMCESIRKHCPEEDIMDEHWGTEYITMPGASCDV
jgi:hypothetical protein